MEAQDKNEQILTDYSGFKRMSFIPGENSVDDISVMEINTTQGHFAQYIIPEQYSVPTYCMQFILKGELRVIVNNQLYTIKANEGFLMTPDFLVKKPDDTENHVEMRILALSRKFLEEVNPQFPLTLISHIYVCPHWQMSAKKLQRTMHTIWICCVILLRTTIARRRYIWYDRSSITSRAKISRCGMTNRCHAKKRLHAVSCTSWMPIVTNTITSTGMPDNFAFLRAMSQTQLNRRSE